MRYPRHCLAHYQYILQYHQRYSLQYATHASTSTPLPTLAHEPRHPRCHVTHASMSTTQPKLAHHLRQQATHASTPPTPPTQARKHATHTTHASTLARHPHKHATHATHYPCHPRQHVQHAISQTPIAQMFNPIAELVILIGIPGEEQKAEIEIHPVIAESKLRKCSIQFRVVQTFLCFLLINSLCFTSSRK